VADFVVCMKAITSSSSSSDALKLLTSVSALINTFGAPK
jgi:hypothetical protein